MEQIDITLIDPNPWQPRQSEDAEHIEKIALSIAQDGLMQVPVGRMVDGRVQLAFGHSRLAAYKLL
jgi:ParB family transcriptional regulator, chromosome partitioning protein